MKDILEDFKKFSIERVQEPFIKIEKTDKFKETNRENKSLYKKIKNKLEEKDINNLKDMMHSSEDIATMYIDASYRAGFADGILFMENLRKKDKK